MVKWTGLEEWELLNHSSVDQLEEIAKGKDITIEDVIDKTMELRKEGDTTFS